MKKRGFGVVKRYEGKNINLPTRQTKSAAGYDFEVAEDFVLPSIWTLNFVRIFRLIRNGHDLSEKDYELAQKTLKPLLVPTGIKAYMPENEVLILANRSSNPLKRGLVLPNGIGVIDADYYNNANNEGEIFVQLINLGVRKVTLKKGERIAQGIFMPFMTVDDEDEITNDRTGGFGSSGIKGAN